MTGEKEMVTVIHYRGIYQKWKKEHGWPDFEPDNGICYQCGKNIYLNPYTQRDINEGKPVTGCRWCCYSFVE